MKKYDELANFIISSIGGKENIEDLTHCMTRLRFKVKDESKVNIDELSKHEGIITTMKAGGLRQVVIGNHVGDVYSTIIENIGNISNDDKANSDNKKKLLDRFTETITKVIVPVLGVLSASGLLKGLVSLLTALNVISNNDGAHIILNAMGDSLFYFFPIILGYTSAEAFKLNKFVGMLIGASLVYPGLTTSFASGNALYTIFANTPFHTNVYSTFFGIPIIFPSTGYVSTVIPIILSIYFTARIERIFKKYIPEIIGFAITPFLTILISVPLTILLIGPIANILNMLILNMTVSLYKFSPILTAIIIGLIYQPLVIFGLHWPLITIGLNNFLSAGNDYILPIIFTANFAQTAVVMAVLSRTKRKDVKAICIPAIISGLMCIIEPAIYGVTLPKKKRFIISCIAGTIGGIILTAFSVKMYAPTVGILGFVGYITPSKSFSGLILAVIATIAAMIVAFVLTFFTFDKEIDENENTKNKKIIIGNEVIESPMKGKIIPLSELEDAAFSNELLGKGIAVDPVEGKVIAPCAGTVTSFFPTGHALGIITDSGIEILIHVGQNTVQLEGKYFHKKVDQGSRVKKGDLLLEFDLDKIKDEGYDVVTPIIITNTKEYRDILETTEKSTTYFEKILTVIQ